VMSLLYGIDVVAAKRWNKPPDLILSGPNEGQNVGYIVVSSGTVSNTQYALFRGIPAIALSAGSGTADNVALANPESPRVAKLSLDLVTLLDRRAGNAPLLPPGIALNVNFPDRLDGAKWRMSRIGTFNAYRVRFTDNLGGRGGPGLTFDVNKEAPERGQKNDESFVYRTDIAISPMQAAYEPAKPEAGAAIRSRLKRLLSK
jgi:5'-nucleotidase